MKRYMKFMMLTGLSAMLLASAACYDAGDTPTAIVETVTPAAASEEETVHVDATPVQEDALPAVPETEPPTPEPTPEPPKTPAPTREPIEGDVSTDRFPNEDTGADADWSYQSDELRVAIRRVENEDDQIVYYVADVWVRNINSFRTELANGKYSSGREDPEKFANRINAVFGISGTMNSGLVVHNGTKYRGADNSTGNTFRSGILIVYRDGSVKTINRNKHQSLNYNNENKQNGGILHALQFGPILVQNGEIPSGLKQRERHPRIIFGYCEPGHYICVAVDGRTKTSIGMTEQEMAELMLSLGCTEAMNLDGGNSAVMLFMGETINVPSGTDRDGDGVAGRNIVDMLAFAEFDADGNAPSLSSVHADKFLRSEP